ncbi:MAG TPA: hypothetical protein VMK12_33040 [Anaeromyxobacteraceae bacterium]|nr:hypothetical protein [Anaeromyxobacteraceae bacterium]
MGKGQLRAAGHIYNAVLGEALRVLDLMRESKEWRAARALFQDSTQKGERRTAFTTRCGRGSTSGRP